MWPLIIVMGDTKIFNSIQYRVATCSKVHINTIQYDTKCFKIPLKYLKYKLNALKRLNMLP